MATSIFLAQLIGPLLLVMGVGILVRPQHWRAMAKEFIASPALIYLAGVLAFVPGLAIVLSHNVWTADWRIVVTALGWLALVGGIVRLLLPQQVQAMGRAMIERPAVLTSGAIVMLALGALLAFFGYFR